MKNDSPKKRSKKNLSFPIVAIGASTGGTRSFREMLEHLPAHTGMAYIYIQNMDGDHNADLTGMFRKSSKLMVHEAKESTLILPNQVYVVPPHRNMHVVDGHLTLKLDPVKRGS